MAEIYLKKFKKKRLMKWEIPILTNIIKAVIHYIYNPLSLLVFTVY